MGGSTGGGEGEGCLHACGQGRDRGRPKGAEERGGQVRGLLAPTEGSGMATRHCRRLTSEGKRDSLERGMSSIGRQILMQYAG